MRILDIGCGEGNCVRSLREAGYDAWGCEIGLRETPGSRELAKAGYIKPIPMNPYRLPFDDKQFDVILSDEVLEHVMNYEDFIAENYRVQKDGGVSLHLFPGRYTPIEMHVFVPLASVHRSYAWLLLWALLGVRNEFQKGMKPRKVAQLNWNFLREHTNYLSTPTIRALFLRKYSSVQFREGLFLKSSESARGKWMNWLITVLPFLLPVYRNFHSRVMLVYR
jgi:SAM-dependent methyltransferase